MNSQNKFRIVMSMLLSLSGSVTLSAAHASDDNTRHEISDDGTVHGVRGCNKAHNKFKQALKDLARGHCESSHNSSGGNKLRQENYTKDGCLDEEKGNQQAGVFVEGTLSYYCK